MMLNRNKKILTFCLLILVLFLLGCGLVGEASKQPLGGPKIKQLQQKNVVNIEEIKEKYIEAYDLQKLPQKIETTSLYLQELNYFGNLNPFPTKSLQDYITLKKYGIIDSKTVDLGGFYLLEGPQTKITSLVKNSADLIKEGTTTEETVKNIMLWEHAALKCSKEESLQYQKRERTADDIIFSKCATGCIDYTTVFAALARAKGISATVTETVREKWIAEMVWNNNWNGKKEGHFFSEIFLPEEGAWVVIDPTGNKLSGRDEKGYYHGPGNKKYLLFERGLDSWDYGIKTDGEFADIVKKRYYVESGDQP